MAGSCIIASCCLFVPQICQMSICKLLLVFGSLSDKWHFPVWLASWTLPCEALATWCSIGSYRWQLTVGGVRQALSRVVSVIHGTLCWKDPPMLSSRLEFVARHVSDMSLFVEMTSGSGVARKLAVLGQKSRERSCSGSVANNVIIINRLMIYIVCN